MSSSAAFGVHFATPVLVRLQQEHPSLMVEFVIATRPLLGTVGAEVEIVVAEPGRPPEGTVRPDE